MAWWLTTLCYYLKQCRLIVNEALFHYPPDKKMLRVSDTSVTMYLLITYLKLELQLRGQRMKIRTYNIVSSIHSQRAKFMGPIWGPPGSCRPQMGPMLAPWTLLSGFLSRLFSHKQHSLRSRLPGLCVLFLSHTAMETRYNELCHRVISF